MPRAVKIVHKELTASDFFWINQPGLPRGGGQSYIDFDTSDITEAEWRGFFSGCTEGEGESGPFWTFSVRNLGSNHVQRDVKLGQRRKTSFSIRSQKLPEHSKGGQRLHAWSPHFSNFPAIPEGITSAEQVPFALISGLRIFLIRDDEDKFWAGWTRLLPPEFEDPQFQTMFNSKSGLINLNRRYEIAPANANWPFKTITDNVEISERGAPILKNDSPKTLPNDEEGLWDPSDFKETADANISYSLQKVRKRNQKAAKSVRQLYTGCQISGDAFVFKTATGKPYLEIHHLIPLGQGGADSPYNMIAVSAHIHKMLHHAEVSPIDLTKINDNSLTISINGQPALITWHPKHANLVLQQNSSS